VEIDDWAARLNSGGTQRQASEKRPHPFANGAKGWATRGQVESNRRKF
jgi:hypothetical protein